MAYKGPHGITILEGLEAVRRRPEMYIGGKEVHPFPRVRLLEYVVDDIAHEPQAEIRILLWCKDTISIAYDGGSLPIEPFSLPADGVAHPALYQSFMHLFAGGMIPFGTSSFGPVLNALSERLVVSTMHAGDRYRVVFSKGRIVSLLSRTHCDRPLGTTWLTYHPDVTIVTGEALTPGDAHGIAERVGQKTECVRIRVEDRMTEDADWY
jgi:DNA gyrase/topoisomerase IV subunit B